MIKFKKKCDINEKINDINEKLDSLKNKIDPPLVDQDTPITIYNNQPKKDNTYYSSYGNDSWYGDDDCLRLTNRIKWLYKYGGIDSRVYVNDVRGLNDIINPYEGQIIYVNNVQEYYIYSNKCFIRLYYKK